MPNEPGPAPVSREVVLDVRLPGGLPTDRVEVRRIRMVAGHPAGLHVHNEPVFGSIVAGSVWYQVEGEPTSELLAGDVFYEPQDARIVRFDAGPYGVEFLAYFPLSSNQQPEIAFPEA
jgi:quercetin dioxygenase-like cupin family protein